MKYNKIIIKNNNCIGINCICIILIIIINLFGVIKNIKKYEFHSVYELSCLHTKNTVRCSRFYSQIWDSSNY